MKKTKARRIKHEGRVSSIKRTFRQVAGRVSTCPSGALTLARKPQEAQLEIPKNQMEAHALRLKERAKAKADLNDKLRRHKKA